MATFEARAAERSAARSGGYFDDGEQRRRQYAQPRAALSGERLPAPDVPEPEDETPIRTRATTPSRPRRPTSPETTRLLASKPERLVEAKHSVAPRRTPGSPGRAIPPLEVLQGYVAQRKAAAPLPPAVQKNGTTRPPMPPSPGPESGPGPESAPAPTTMTAIHDEIDNAFGCGDRAQVERALERARSYDGPAPLGYQGPLNVLEQYPSTMPESESLPHRDQTFAADDASSVASATTAVDTPKKPVQIEEAVPHRGGSTASEPEADPSVDGVTFEPAAVAHPQRSRRRALADPRRRGSVAILQKSVRTLSTRTKVAAGGRVTTCPPPSARPQSQL
jgi:hypothetical protein